MNEFKVKALRAAYDKAKHQMENVRNEPIAPWRERPEDWVDQEHEAEGAFQEISDMLIQAEREAYGPDPEQLAEMMAEKAAELHLMGSHDDPSLYFHTPTQEEQFQEGILRQIRNGWYDEDGGWNEGTDAPYEDDEGFMLDGYPVLPEFFQEALRFMEWLSWATNVELIDVNEWGEEFRFAQKEDAHA